MDLFFELLQVALGTRTSLSIVPTQEQWEAMYAHAEEQTLVGVCFSGIERLPREQQPGYELKLQWWGIVRQIEERNKELNMRSVEACRYFEEHGFMACVLKGQGNARMYVVNGKANKGNEKGNAGRDMRLRRQSGDIDVWVVPDSCSQYSVSKSRWKVLQWARRQFPQEEYDLKHIHFPVMQDVPMEVHFVPSLLRSLTVNRRLQRFYEGMMQGQMAHRVRMDGVGENLGELVCPTTGFNLVFQLTHIFAHFISEGVGLRQVVDYYFVLRTLNEELNANKEKGVALEIIKSIGLYSFLQALMWVQHEVLGLEEAYLIAPMDERRGRVLLDEILAGGNFGHYGSRYWYQGMSKWTFYVARVCRMSHLLRYFPREVLGDVPFRIRQRIWMVGTALLLRNMKYKS